MAEATLHRDAYIHDVGSFVLGFTLTQKRARRLREQYPWLDLPAPVSPAERLSNRIDAAIRGDKARQNQADRAGLLRTLQVDAERPLHTSHRSSSSLTPYKQTDIFGNRRGYSISDLPDQLIECGFSPTNHRVYICGYRRTGLTGQCMYRLNITWRRCNINGDSMRYIELISQLTSHRWTADGFRFSPEDGQSALVLQLRECKPADLSLARPAGSVTLRHGHLQAVPVR